MYSIYHIPGVKIGCSTNPKIRVKRQGYTDFEILETYEDIDIASQREIELQKQYGYEESNIHTNYKQHYEYGKKGRENITPGKGAQTQIKNKIGIFGYSKEERLALNTKANFIRAKISAEKRQRAINAYEYKTNKFVGYFKSIKEAGLTLNIKSNIHSTIIGKRKHTKGYRFEYA